MMDSTLMELASAVILLAIFVTGFLALLAGLILVCVDIICFIVRTLRRLPKRRKVYRAT
jgi:hypothetical protein